MKTEIKILAVVGTALTGAGACGHSFDASNELYLNAGIAIQQQEDNAAREIGRPIQFDISQATAVVNQYRPLFSSENPCNLDIAAIDNRLKAACKVQEREEATNESWQKLVEEKGIKSKKDLYEKYQLDYVKLGVSGTIAMALGIIGGIHMMGSLESEMNGSRTYRSRYNRR